MISRPRGRFNSPLVARHTRDFPPTRDIPTEPGPSPNRFLAKPPSEESQVATEGIRTTSPFRKDPHVSRLLSSRGGGDQTIR